MQFPPQVSIIPFFHALNFAHVATLLAAILTERKVLFISSSYAMLSLAAETLCGLIWPLQVRCIRLCLSCMRKICLFYISPT